MGQDRQSPTREAEIGFAGPVAGVDEAGRGPLCGPVVAAAVLLPGSPGDPLPEGLRGLADSKKLSATKREILFEAVTALCVVGVGSASPAEIDEINILQATFLAMRRAVAAMPIQPGHLLIDGNRLPKALPCSATAIVKGDASCCAIAAASIVAKVTRDRLLTELDREYPGYGWSRNAGYPTADHRAAISQLGVTPHHRKTFGGVSEFVVGRIDLP